MSVQLQTTKSLPTVRLGRTGMNITRVGFGLLGHWRRLGRGLGQPG